MDLKSHADRLRSRTLKSVVEAGRTISEFDACGWNINVSRQFLDADAETALAKLASQKDLPDAVERLFTGKTVNPSEGRAALHWALRAQETEFADAERVRKSSEAAEALASDIANGRKTAANGHPFKAIVHIGIGGSDFGPRLIADAFHDSRLPDVELRYCANLDPLDLELALAGLDPAETLVVGVSKSFGTEETLYNLTRARDWVRAGVPADWAKHFVLVTANPERATAWLNGAKGLILDLPESVGGRFSIWSAGSVACSITLSSDVMKGFRRGAAEMDAHVQTAPVHENAAIQLAMLDYWNASFMGFGARALLAYSRRLRLLPAYLQQLEMESNGKSVGPAGAGVGGATTPLLWGGEGTIGQHSYHQWLHQSPSIVAAEFILAPGSRTDEAGVTGLTAHALAQAEVLANGRTLEEVQKEEPDLPAEIAAQKVHAGGRPSTFISTSELTPEKLGSLIALYEHRTYLAGVLWGLNSFDQWGVERGKTMASRLKPDGEGSKDAVTNHLIKRLQT